MACVILSACSREEQFVPMAHTSPPVTAKTTETSATLPSAPIVYDEPPEQVLSDFMFAQYAELEAQGGLPMTVAASGKSGIIRAKLYSVAKDKCHHSPVDPPGMFECGTNLMGTLWWDGQREPTKPLSDAKRILVIKDADGKWVDCTYGSDKKSICKTGVKL